MSVAGPGCAAIVAANGNAMCHLPSAEAVFSGASEADPSTLRESTHGVVGLHGSPLQSLLKFTVLPPRSSWRVFHLCVAQRLRQLGISAIVGQQEDYRRARLRVAAWSQVVGYRPFAPMRPGFQPEDLRSDIAGLRVGEQIAGNQGIGLG